MWTSESASFAGGEEHLRPVDPWTRLVDLQGIRRGVRVA